MKLTKVKKGFILKDAGLKINFTSYEYSDILNEVYLYRNGVLVAIYENREQFEKQLKSC
jgi:hypothetical protein